MPIYEYECEKCGNRFEKIQKFSDPPVDACPKCGGHVHKMQSAPAFQFKGTGWYATDYAKSGQSETKETKSTSESKSESKPESKSESAKTDSSSTSGGSEPKSGS
jgi:putative FmdB family regulatory protein